MNKEELWNKVKELVSSGNLEEAKKFMEEHKDELGEYFEQAKALLKNVDLSEIANKFKGLFGK